MNNIDRLIRIIYKEIPLHEIINKKVDYYDYKNSNDEYRDYFNLNNNKFRKFIKEKYLKVYPNNYNSDEVEYIVEEIKNIINKNYIKENKESCNSVKMFLYVSDKLLFINSNEVKISFDDLLELNGFINKIDGDILFAAKLALENRSVNRYHKFRILHDNTRLSNILSRGVSENHMHLKGSGYTAEMNWYEFSNMKEMELIEFEEIIKYRNKETEVSEIISFYKTRFIKFYLFSKVKKFDKNFFKEDEERFEESIEELLNYSSMESYYSFFQRNKKNLYKLQEAFIKEYDCFSNSSKRFFLIERMFLKELFDLYLAGEMNTVTLYLFNVYLLATSKFKLLFYQDNIGMGFEKFKYSENIKTSLLKNYNKIEIYKTVFDKYYEEKCVRKIEFRVAPKDKVQEYIKLIEDLEIAEKVVRNNLKISPSNKINYGLIVHYIKNKEEFDEREGVSRKEKTYYELSKECDSLVSFFSEYDSARKNLADESLLRDNYREKIVGIDSANYEFNCRPELLGYIYRKQRKEIYSSHKLKFTYHVGEDFTTLADGLRAIDEVIEFLNFGRGDRFGHALALGLDIDKYFKTKRYKMIQNLESYIDDIVWMRYLIESEDIDELNSIIKDDKYTVTDIIQYLEMEFNKYFRKYDLSDYSMYDYYCSYKLRGDLPDIYGEINYIYNKEKHGNDDTFYKRILDKYNEKINLYSKDHKECFLNPKGRDLFFRYHFSKEYKIKHNEIVSEDIKEIYVEAVRIAQLALRKKVYRMEIGIESNPSSNRKISFISKYIDLPFINFNKKYLSSESKYNLSTSINTDDSGIFQTDLSLEYAYVAASLEREGFDVESIYEYIDYIRQTSMHQSFLADSTTTVSSNEIMNY